jgi:hypothetical protein
MLHFGGTSQDPKTFARVPTVRRAVTRLDLGMSAARIPPIGCAWRPTARPAGRGATREIGNRRRPALQPESRRAARGQRGGRRAISDRPAAARAQRPRPRDAARRARSKSPTCRDRCVPGSTSFRRKRDNVRIVFARFKRAHPKSVINGKVRWGFSRGWFRARYR